MVVQHAIKVVGPRESRASYANLTTVFTVSRAEDWQRELSPFHLGPVRLYDGTSARCMENAYQFSKVYARHVGPRGEVSPAYWAWAREGWSRPAVRYPMGKGAKPEFVLWGGERLDYVECRRRVYWPLYRDAVRQTGAWRRLQELYLDGALALWDFDGFDHDGQGLSLSDVINQTRRPMGHAFVLKAMLLYGADVEADDVIRREAASGAVACAPAPAAAQADLFTELEAPAPSRFRPR